MKRVIIIAALLLTFGLTAQAQMVGATNNQQTPRVQRGDNSPLYHPTGGALRFETGFPHVLNVAYVHHLTPSFMFGGGTGVSGCGETRTRYYSDGSRSEYRWNEDELDACLPLFLEAELHTPRFKWSLFLNVKAGYNLLRHKDGGWSENSYYNGYYYLEYKYDRFFFDASVGFSYKNLSLGLGYSTVFYGKFSLSYNLPVSTISKWFF